MVLFTKAYGEPSLRIQQSLRRCNNRGALKAHAGATERQETPRLREEVNERFAKTPLGLDSRCGMERSAKIVET
jgi:hypothetical protein